MVNISVITVTYNLIAAGREEEFRKSFRSVHSQIHPSIEHVIVDGASTDGTQALIKELIAEAQFNEGYGKPIRYLSEPDTGLYDAMNKGVELADGKYVLFLASDDYLYIDEALSAIGSSISEQQPDYIYGRQISLFKDGSTKVWRRMSPLSVLNCMPFGFASLFFRRDLFHRLGGFDSRYKIAADYDFVLRMIENDSHGISLDYLIAVFREGGISCNEERTAQEVVAIWREHFSKYLDLSPYENSEMVCWHRTGQIPVAISRAIKYSSVASMSIKSAARHAFWKTLQKKTFLKKSAMLTLAACFTCSIESSQN